MKSLLFFSVLLLATSNVHAKKSCDELVTEIEARINAKGVKSFTLKVVPADEKTDLRVVGTCEGGARKIVYKRD